MIIKVLHLYHDLMNLYGEYGNIAVLCRYLEDAGIEVQLDKVSVDDSFNITDYNFVYCGAGTERNQKVALADLISHKDELKTYIKIMVQRYLQEILSKCSAKVSAIEMEIPLRLFRLLIFTHIRAEKAIKSIFRLIRMIQNSLRTTQELQVM